MPTLAGPQHGVTEGGVWIFQILWVPWIPRIRFSLISFRFPPSIPELKFPFKILLKLLYRVHFFLFSENPYSWSDVLFISFYFLDLVLQLVWEGPEENLIDFYLNFN